MGAEAGAGGQLQCHQGGFGTPCGGCFEVGVGRKVGRKLGNPAAVEAGVRRAEERWKEKHLECRIAGRCEGETGPQDLGTALGRAPGSVGDRRIRPVEFGTFESPSWSVQGQMGEFKGQKGARIYLPYFEADTHVICSVLLAGLLLYIWNVMAGAALSDLVQLPWPVLRVCTAWLFDTLPPVFLYA